MLHIDSYPLYMVLLHSMVRPASPLVRLAFTDYLVPDEPRSHHPWLR